MLFWDVDSTFLGKTNLNLSKREIVEEYSEYADEEIEYFNQDRSEDRGVKLSPYVISQPVLSLFESKEFNRLIVKSLQQRKKEQNKIKLSSIFKESLKVIPKEILDRKLPF